MFESDDFDQVLSQFDFPELSVNVCGNIGIEKTSLTCQLSEQVYQNSEQITEENVDNHVAIAKENSKCKETKVAENMSPKHTKRKIINSFFDTNRKRKFPGPAGLLTEKLENNKDENICQMELLSQDVDFSQNILKQDVFESPLWERLLEDLVSWDMRNVNPIKVIKEQALTGHLRKRKAQIVTAFVEAIDRSATDPLIILRDLSGTIKCTLHRDAWLTFSMYIASGCCALVLWKPTVLTTGSAFKKHYLNITLSNIFAVYSSTVLEETDEKQIAGYKKVYETEFTVFKTEAVDNQSDDIRTEEKDNSGVIGDEELLDGLDSSIFLDDIF